MESSTVLAQYEPQRKQFQESQSFARKNAVLFSSLAIDGVTAVVLTILGGLALRGVLNGTALGTSAIGLGALGVVASFISRQSLTRAPAGTNYCYSVLAIIPLACAVLGILYLSQTISITVLGGVMTAGIASPFLGLATGALVNKCIEG